MKTTGGRPGAEPPDSRRRRHDLLFNPVEFGGMQLPVDRTGAEIGMPNVSHLIRVFK